MADESNASRNILINDGVAEIRHNDGRVERLKAMEDKTNKGERELTKGMRLVANNNDGKIYVTDSGDFWLLTESGNDFRMLLIKDRDGTEYPT